MKRSLIKILLRESDELFIVLLIVAIVMYAFVTVRTW